MSALLSALQLPSLREGVLAETGGVLGRSSRLSRLAEQLAWAIRQSVPSAVEPDCPRNAVNTFFYRDPDTLPTTAPATSVSSEPHSFSRVFTGAFFEGLAGMLATTGTKGEAALLQMPLNGGVSTPARREVAARGLYLNGGGVTGRALLHTPRAVVRAI
jgi:hypothetical protein